MLLTSPSMPLATSARAAAACSLAGLATDTEGANVLDGASAVKSGEMENNVNYAWNNTWTEWMNK